VTGVVIGWRRLGLKLRTPSPRSASARMGASDLA
jgi:hypothetical protein